MEKCAVCSSPAPHHCAACHKVAYCSRQHQKQHWTKHRSNCRPFKICQNEILGRYLVATRTLQPGEIILQEPPMIFGPAQISAPVCLGKCGCLLQEGCDQCPECGWPMCGSPECLGSPTHEPECRFTKQRGTKINISNYVFPHPNYQCITVLRILFQRDHNKLLWDKLIKLQSHCEERKETAKYESDRVNVAQFIRRFFKMENKFTEEEILKICGILQVNGHEIPLLEQPHVAIYEQCSMFEHNCKPNCCKSFSANGDLLIQAGREISSGEHLSICYTDSLWGTLDRRHFLDETKFFQCQCERCQDPTEFGTYFSALRCPDKSCSGFVLPKTFLISSKSETPEHWECSLCPKTMSYNAVIAATERVGKDLHAMRKGDADSCRLFLSHYQKLLHFNHYHLTDVKFALMQLIGQQEGGLSEVTNEELQMKLNLCEELNKLLEIINPAEVRVRGTILFELHAALAESARRQALRGEDNWRNLLERCSYLLIQTSTLLQHEPPELPEGKLCIQARENLQQLEVVLERSK